MNNKILNNKIITYISFAKKSGSLCVGFNAVKFSIISKKANLVILFDDISDKTQKEIVRICDIKNIKYIKLAFKSEDLIHIFYKKYVVISLSDNNLSSAILSNCTNNLL